MPHLSVRFAALYAVAMIFCGAPTGALAASHRFDGSWNLLFVSRYGDCDPRYNFTVNIHRGIITHPNLVRFRGRVGRNGATHASVRVGSKYASGSGRLSAVSGRGNWVGHSGTARCAGNWSASRN